MLEGRERQDVMSADVHLVSPELSVTDQTIPSRMLKKTSSKAAADESTGGVASGLR